MKTSVMNRTSTLFLKAVICLVGLGALVFLLWFPQVEGRNANSDPISLYFNDPFLAYVYVASITFFVALYQAFKLLGYIEQDTIFSHVSIKALRTIKYCFLTFIGFIVVALPFIVMMAKAENDDPAGFVALSLIVIVGSTVAVVTAGVLQKIVQRAIDKKS